MGATWGNVSALVVLLAIIALVVWASNKAVRDEVARFGWAYSLLNDGKGGHLAVVARVTEVGAVLALDDRDLSAQAVPPAGEACVYCRASIPHTAALHRAMRRAHGFGHEERWHAHRNAVRRFLGRAYMQHQDQPA